MVDKYYEETGVKVELLSAPFADTKTQIVSGVSTGTVADIVSVDGSWVYDFVNLATKDTEWLSSRQTALATITFVNIWCGYPFYMISILAGLQGISPDLFESAALDGANTWKTFRNITIPQLKPILVSIAMLDFIWTIQSFSTIWMLTGGGPVKSTETLSIYIYKTGEGNVCAVF